MFGFVNKPDFLILLQTTSCTVDEDRERLAYTEASGLQLEPRAMLFAALRLVWNATLVNVCDE